MFGNLGTHLIKFPSNRYGYVGTLPLVLASIVEPTTSDIMGGRVFTDENGDTKSYKFPSFETADEAKEFAKYKGVELITHVIDKNGNKKEII